MSTVKTAKRRFQVMRDEIARPAVEYAHKVAP